MQSSKSDQIRREGLGVLSVLPDSLLSVISFYLDVRTVCKLACCSRLLRVFAYEPCLWMHHALTGHDGPLAYQINWRQTALSLLYQAVSATAADRSRTDTLSRQQQLLDNLATAAAAAAIPLSPLQGFHSDFLYRRWYRSHVMLSGFVPPVDQVARVRHGNLDADSFTQLYDRPAQPVILTGFMDAEWPAGWQQHWQLDNLSSTYSTAVFRASRPSGGKTTMRLGDYIDYMTRQADEEPLYVFDEEFGETAPDMLEWYKPPSVITQDLTSVLGSADRPDHRWLVLGPAAAGAAWHVDPALTSAWNSLTSGLKRWALYPPHVRPPGLKDVQHQQQQCWMTAGTGPNQGGSAEQDAISSSSSSWCTVTGSEDDDDVLSSWSGSSSSSAAGDESAGSGLTSLQWYLEVYPHLQPHQRPYEFTQHPGETVYIPGGWWHLVLNLQPSVALTENFVTEANFNRVVGQLALGSRAYERDVLGFYEAGGRPWVGDWQQHQRQQWLLWQQQQRQQQAEECLFAAATAVSSAATQEEEAVAQAAVASPPSQVAATTGADCCLCTCWTVHQSPYSASITAAQITCFTAAAAAAADSQASEQGQIACVDPGTPWQHVLQCINGHEGYRRSRILGPWLKQLWQQQQQHNTSVSGSDTPTQQQRLHQQIKAVAKKYLGHQQWQQLLRAISEAHGICTSSSSSEEADEPCFPAVGSDSLVFTTGPAVVKLLVGQDELPAQIAATVEVRLMHRLQQQQQQQQHFQSTDVSDGNTASAAAASHSPGQQQEQTNKCIRHLQRHEQQQQQVPLLSTPSILGYGTIYFSSGSTSSSNKSDNIICHVPYIVMSRVDQSVTAADVADQLSRQQQQQLAVACGMFLAQLHSLPLDLSPGSSRCSTLQMRRPPGVCSTEDQGAAVACWCCISSAAAGKASNESRPGAAAAAVAQQQQHHGQAVVVEGLADRLLMGSVWRSRDGTIWSSQLGCLTEQQQQQLLEHAASSATTTAAAVAASLLDSMNLGCMSDNELSPPLAADSESTAATAGMLPARGVSSLNLAAGGPDSSSSSSSIQPQAAAEGVGVRGAWWPFVHYLQQRRTELLQQLAAEETDLLRLGTVATEVYRHFPAAADQLAVAEAQRQQQTQHSCGAPKHTSSSCCRSNSSNTSTSPFPVIGVGEECLPSWLVQQVEAYLPIDMGQLVTCNVAVGATTIAAAAAHPCTSSCITGGTGFHAAYCDCAQGMGIDSSCSSSCRRVMRQPVWLHGDLMAGNLLLKFRAQEEPEHQQQQQAGSSMLSGGADCKYSSHTTDGSVRSSGKSSTSVSSSSMSSTSRQLHSSGRDPASPPQTGKQQGVSPFTGAQQVLPELEQVTVVDMSDGGVGDPLYDFVAVFVSVLHSDVDLLKVAIESYNRCLQQGAIRAAASAVGYAEGQHQQLGEDCVASDLEVCLQLSSEGRSNADGRPGQHHMGCSPSKVFLVYLLLHEEGVMGQLLQQHPHLRCAGSLPLLQEQLFGWLDDCWTCNAVQLQSTVCVMNRHIMSPDEDGCV